MLGEEAEEVPVPQLLGQQFILSSQPGTLRIRTNFEADLTFANYYSNWVKLKPNRLPCDLQSKGGYEAKVRTMKQSDAWMGFRHDRNCSRLSSFRILPVPRIEPECTIEPVLTFAWLIKQTELEQNLVGHCE